MVYPSGPVVSTVLHLMTHLVVSMVNNIIEISCFVKFKIKDHMTVSQFQCGCVVPKELHCHELNNWFCLST